MAAFLQARSQAQPRRSDKYLILSWRRWWLKLAAMPQIQIRPITPADAPHWRKLWTGYLEFYESSVSEAVYESTFARLFDPGTYEPNAFLAWQGTEAVGLVHYLQDLYAAPSARGSGVGRALIEAVYAEADRLSLGAVYWMTAEDNATARLLYDLTAQKTPFIKYQR